MKGVVLSEDGIALEEITLDPPGEHEVRVRVVANGLCHTDLHVIETGGWGMRLPVLLGHEGAGIVEELGPGVTTVAEGDRVVIAWRAPCGDSCPACRRGDPRRCSNNLRARRRSHRASDGALLTPVLRCGTLSDAVVVHEACAVKVPEELPFEQACLLACGFSTGAGAALWTSPVYAGASVAVIGCGGVGLAVVQGAKLAGAERIVAVDIAPEKLATAQALGATDVVDASALDAVETVRGLTGSGVDFAFSAVGAASAMEQAVRMCGYAGTATLVGLPSPGREARARPREGRVRPEAHARGHARRRHDPAAGLPVPRAGGTRRQARPRSLRNEHDLARRGAGTLTPDWAGRRDQNRGAALARARTLPRRNLQPPRAQRTKPTPARRSRHGNRTPEEIAPRR